MTRYTDITYDFDRQGGVFVANCWRDVTIDHGLSHRIAYDRHQRALDALIFTAWADGARRIWQTFELPPFVYESFLPTNPAGV